MMQLELDRQLLRRAGGTWALGVGVGYAHATGAALEADLKTPSGDETGLRLIPLSAALVYRADILRERYGSPLVPYAKLGLDCTLWHMSDTSQASVDGRTFGWHAAAGVTLDLSILDPEASHTMDRESGVNQTAVFVELARYSLDGFGSSAALHVGDTTWFAGLMLEALTCGVVKARARRARREIASRRRRGRAGRPRTATRSSNAPRAPGQPRFQLPRGRSGRRAPRCP